jgi:hypothetical protein
MLALEDEDDLISPRIHRVPREPGAAGIERRPCREQLPRALFRPRPQLNCDGNAVHGATINAAPGPAIGTRADPMRG